ncbi:MAG: DNA translocase FtsK 4TM domain-containing protein [Bacteroidales bacterium]
MSKTKVRNKNSTKTKFITNFRSFYAQHGDNIKKIYGFFLIIFGLYLTVAFSSFLFNYFQSYSDESIRDISLYRIFFDSEIVTHNIAGKLGAFLSYLIINESFGISSFLIVFFLIAWGINFISGKQIFLLLRVFSQLLISAIWISLFLGFFFQNEPLNILGGYFGFKLNTWMTQVLGRPGTFLIILFYFFSFTQIKYKFPLRTIIWLATKWKEYNKQQKEKRRIRAEEKRLQKERETEEENELEETEINEEHKFSYPNKSNEDLTLQYEKEDSFIVNEHEPSNTSTHSEAIPEDPQVSFNIDENPYEDSKIQDDPITEKIIHNLEEDNSQETESTKESDLYSTSNIFKNNLDFSNPEQNTENTELFPSDDSLAEIEVNNTESNPEEELQLETQEIIQEQIIETKDQERGTIDTLFDPKLDLARYELPPIDLLVDYGDGNINVEREELQANKDRIVDTLNNYGIKIDKIRATIGPTITLYEIIPAPGVRISKIKNLEDDIALSLSALGIRIIAPIPGKGTIGIEVPNQNPEMVAMKTVISSKKFQESKMALPLALGKTISNETFVTDLAKMPHLLMAGATGQGKSVGINAILASLLYKKHPAELKFVLVDPKKVELSIFSKIERHYLAKLPDAEEAIITDTTKVVNTLNSLCIEMDNRYDLLKNAFCRNLKEYNEKFINRKLNPKDGHRYLPYIVLIIDEFADLIMNAGKEIETPIARLAQLARAIGIHLIIATQRPSTNIITGTIKANFPARISFRVISSIDSRTILDSPGANNLIGKGDMLLNTGSELTRIQCAFIDTPEVEAITDYIGSQQGYTDAFLLPEYSGESENTGNEINISDRDALFEDAARIIVQSQQGSTSMLQRKLKLGYNRAGRIVDQLEAVGVLGPFEGSKAREVRISTEEELERLLNSLN